MATISLPEFPKDREFEEYVSAFFQASGLFVERNIVQREVEEVLELDIISSNYKGSAIDITLVEVKSGSWGYPDLFKLIGWMNYLDYSNNRALMVAQVPKKYTKNMKEKMEPLNVFISEISNLEFQLTKSGLSNYLGKNEVSEMDISFWRFSYWMERNLLRHLKAKTKSITSATRYGALESYNFDITSGVFFTVNILDRVNKLYSAFMEMPHLSAKCGHEMIGDKFDETYTRLPDKIFSQTYFACDLNDIQISSYLEHKARLAILKAAIDYTLYKQAGDLKRAEDRMLLLNIGFSIKQLLPATFLRGLEEISKEPYFYLYPIFWQIFMFLFGGFILLDYQDQDFKLLSLKSGIPVSEIPNALSAMQKLFPTVDGWFWDK